MKKYIFSLLAAVASLTACNNNDIVPEDNSNPMHQVTIDVATEQGLNTRAGETSADRYVIEFYTDAAYTTVANVFSDGTKNQATSQNGIFSLVLDRTQEYYCLLWADKAGTDVYETTSLKAVTLKSGATPVEAWHGKLKIEPGNESTLNVSLKRAVAKITLKETGYLPAGTLILGFEQNTKFDVSTAAIATGDTRSTRKTITVAETTGTKDAPVKINTNDIFVLASVADAEMPTLTFKMGSEESFEIPNVPLKANYNTNITGHYTKLNGTTFTVTCDDSQWENSDNEVTLPNIIWATGNLVANADKSGCEIGNPTDNGLYFQFGSLIGWSNEAGDNPVVVVKPADCNVTSWIYNWKAGFPVTENTEKGTGDPCKYYLEGTWRLPTLNEYKALFNNTADDTGYANTGGWSYTSESISNSALGLTFPATGTINQGYMEDDGHGLWSSLADTESDYKGYYLYFNDSKVGFYRLDGSYGMPIRCVRPNASN